MPAPSKSERLSRISSTFQSQYTTKSGRSVSATDCPLLFGVALRAIQRKSQGFELSKLEKNVAGIWAAFVHDDDEMAEYNKLFSQHDITQRLPEAVTQLAIDKPYTWEDLHRDIVETSPGIAQTPNANVVDLATAKENDNTAFKSSMAATGRGATIYTSSDPPTTQATITGHWNIHLDKFECVRKQDDGVFGPKNEIYWAYAGANDTAPSEHNTTREYGSIQSGSTAKIDNGTILFSGIIGAGKCVAAHIECWEADDSNSSWARELKAAMLDVSEMLLDAASSAATSPDGQEGAAVLLILAGISALIAGIIDWFRNDDDLVKERSIILDYPALLNLYNKPGHTDWWQFDGGKEGCHKLFLTLKPPF